METVHLSEKDINPLFEKLANAITTSFPQDQFNKRPFRIMGIPRGGVPVAYRIAGMTGMEVTDKPEIADVLVDDIVCSGRTRDEWLPKARQGVSFFSLINSCEAGFGCKWYVFPWEKTLASSAEDIPIRLLEYIGEDVQRDGLLETPRRFLKAWEFFTKGYKEDPKVILGKLFENEEKYNEMVILRDIEFYSTCEHHLVPFFGKVHIAYIPEGKIVGISKLARLVECFARRLQVQERLTEQIANAIAGNLHPQGVAVLVEAQHLCMVARGVQKQNSVMVTSSLKGCLEEQQSRMEFLLLKR